jgi:hypothetical protein
MPVFAKPVMRSSTLCPAKLLGTDRCSKHGEDPTDCDEDPENSCPNETRNVRACALKCQQEKPAKVRFSHEL